MPRYIVERAQQLLNTHGQALKNAHILLLGVTYKADIADQRETPARPIARRLTRLGAHLTYHDPHVKTWEVDGEPIAPAPEDLAEALASADLAILLTGHAAYVPALLAEHARLLFDARGHTRSMQTPAIETL
ncbi:UDP binding domain-containing protein, partial [Actinomadura sp. 9N407]|uniref:UDP binding domain-containing protein n=1 Tax=Actinomadura sp. 9N407 TaxID=3375154 RepID=UPI00379B52A8